MNFLKSAVASAIAQGPPFPYSFGDKVDIDSSIWTLYNGTKREDGSNCSIFSFDVVANKSRLTLAKNALKKLRTMRHPGVIKVLDAVETETYIYIATERVVPLRWHVKRKSLSPETMKWGLYSVARTIKFINDEGSSIHGNVKIASVYTSESGEWKLGGFEVLSNVKDDDAVVYTYGSLKNPHSSIDAYNYGTLIFEVFNGDFVGADQAGQTKGIPPAMHASYKRLVNANPKARITIGAFLQQGQRSGGFFDTSLIKLTDGIDNLGMKSEEEREAFLSDLDSLTDDFPEDFFKMKVLPELLKSVEFGGGGPEAFGVVMKITTKLSSEDFEARVQPVVIRLFGNPDRAIRVCLLDNLPHMIDRLPPKVVNDKIFPNLVSGFTDLAPVVREQTLKSVLIAKNLGTSSRSKVLIAAFTRSLRDPFVHGRSAALMALAATTEHFTDEDCATKLMPAICPSLIDKEKLVRDQAVKTLDVYMQRVRKAASAMPDTVLPAPTANEGAAGPRMSTPQPSEASSWTGWAISSFTNKLSAAAGEIQTDASANGAANPASSLSAPTPPAGSARLMPTTTSSASALHRQAVTSPPPPTMSRTSSTTAAEAYFKDPEPAFDDFDEGADDAWGEMGDMDENDDNGNADNDDTLGRVPAPFDDGSEPDFAGWLAAQASKKSGAPGGKPLPKGLSKAGGPAGSAATSRKSSATSVAKAKPKPVVAKKIDTTPKETNDDEDGWGDGW
ncbi:hypothetical protein PG994_004435 [Apiospora phragmitis]|uniref:Protein kinase domain-containing protein n=1 Tax=Apiospora phragmitis TaxID=2905665 RepID=A0ABR1VT90_9PEZI